MQVRHEDEKVTLVLSAEEAKWLRRALERASFIDTPVEEQAQIAAFAAKALEDLRRTPMPL
jgi:hypothetical protein